MLKAAAGRTNVRPPIELSCGMNCKLAAITIGAPAPLNGKVQLSPYDRRWPEQFADQSELVRVALGDLALDVQHVGSTSVPGLSAKPLIDMLLVVADSADESAYVSQLEAAGFCLRIREPDWFEHRMLRGNGPTVNLHVFSSGCPEIARMLAFRDHLRKSTSDRALYEATKRALASRDWKFTQDYADAKSEVIEAILARALPTTQPS